MTEPTSNDPISFDALSAVVTNLYKSNNAISMDEIITHLEHWFISQASIDKLTEIPVLNTMQNFHDKQLVRFLCMVQDMRDSELFPGLLAADDTVVNCLFTDNMPQIDYADISSVNTSHLMNRQLLHCIPVPGEANWAPMLAEQLTSLTSNSIFPDSLGKNHDQPHPAQHTDSNYEPSNKRLFSGECNTEQQSDIRALNVIVKIYRELVDVKLNDVIELVGYISCGGEDKRTESILNSLSLHAVTYRVVDHVLSSNIVLDDKSGRSECWIKKTRDQFGAFMQSHLLNDKLAAEYLLCHLLSTSIHKNLMCIGKFVLNLYGVPVTDESFFVQRLHQAMLSVYSRVHYLPLSLEILNKEKLVPWKDYETNTLRTGRLQLASGTLLIIDETQMSTGRLFEQGVKNIEALKTLILHQKLNYDFGFHGIEFQTDFNILILSQGVSCLPCDYAVQLVRQEPETIVGFDCKAIESFRMFLMCMKSRQLEIPEDVQAKIRDDFVSMRREDNSVRDTKLHELIVLSRWLMCSYGGRALTLDFWEQSKNMERQRLERKK